MNRITLGVLVLLLAWPPLRGEDKPPTLRQQFDALVTISQLRLHQFSLSYEKAKTDEEQRKAAKEFRAQSSWIAAGFLTLAEKAPKDPVAVAALGKVFTLNGCAPEKAKAADLMLRDYLQSDKIAPICQDLASALEDSGENVLRAFLAKNPHKSMQAEASFALAQMLSKRFFVAKQSKQDPDFAEWIVRFSGKDVAEEFRKKDVSLLGSAAAKAWSEFAEKYSADIAAGRLMRACFELDTQKATSVEPVLRTLEKDKRREVQAIACLTLGQVLKRRADALAGKDAQAAAKLREKSAGALTRAAEKYGDVKIQYDERSFGGVIGEKAKGELYELRHLSIGMKAPEIDGEDQDGKKFKLSDYKSKVVLLDFWSQH